jgi:hypothetical protein
MQDGKDALVKQALHAEIEALQSYYAKLKEYIAGKDFDSIKIVATLQVFKESLNRITSHILMLYELNKQKTKITWEPLLENLENATTTIRSAKGNVSSAIELAFNMSQPNAQEVMDYLAKLKEALQ